ncbi:hypothetical protein, partial [Lysinibacillus sp. NPDC056185]|uniref:hypothetical protein n=1 Tax=Lysinibacillus sp. NPDC056185 TaxID=3345739 RepID=UPI0039EFF330
GYGTALALTSAYAGLAPDLDLNLLAVTEGALSVAGEAPSRPGHAALSGLLPVLAQENPGWTCRHLDVGAPTPGAPAGPFATAVIAESLAPHRGPVALRGSSRWVRS